VLASAMGRVLIDIQKKASATEAAIFPSSDEKVGALIASEKSSHLLENQHFAC